MSHAAQELSAPRISGIPRNPQGPLGRLNHVTGEQGTEDEDNAEENLDTYRWSSRERGHRPGGRRAGAWRGLDGAPYQGLPGAGARGRPVRPDDRVRRSGDGATDRRGDG